jgi:hypothetical protein
MQRQLQQQQPKPQEPPDVFTDPQGWQAFVQQQTQQAISSQRYEFSEMLARQAYGDKRVAEAEKWAEANIGPAERARVAASRHPYAEVIRMQDERNVLTEIGTDPTAYVQKKLDEALNDPAFLARAIEKARAQAAGQASPQTKPNTVVQLPPSLNRAPGAASPHEDLGDMSDRSLYAAATR